MRIAWGGLAVAMLAACGEVKDGPGLYLDLDTDLVIPEGIDEVGLFLMRVRDGNRTTLAAVRERPLYDAETDTYRVRFAASVAVQADPESPGDRLQARFVGFRRDGTPSVMREARVIVPTNSRKRLRLPLLFINEGRVEDTGARTGGLQWQQAEPDDVFSRLRTVGCADEQTLGDDGECRSIDVDASELLDVDALPTACFSVEACFSEAPGVRELPLEGCRVQLPPLGEGGPSSAGVSVALPSAEGHPGNGGRRLQPLSGALYRVEADGRSLTLLGPACQRAEQIGAGSVWVSVRCAPLAPATPVCSPWQTVTREQPVTNAGFVDDTGAPDADADAEGPPDAFSPTLNVPRLLRMHAFVVDKARTLSVSGSDENEAGAIYRAPRGVEEPTVIPMPAEFYSAALLDLGANGRTLYVLDSELGSAPYVLSPDTETLTPVRFGTAAAACSVPASSAFTFAPGAHDGRTVAAYGDSSQLFAGVATAEGDCFVGTAVPLTSAEPPLRGASANGVWRFPLGDETRLAELSVDNAVALATVDGFDPSESIQKHSLVNTGADTVLVAQAEANTTHVYWLDTLATPYQASAAKRSIPGVTDREIYGGGGLLCARYLQENGRFSVECLERSGATLNPVLTVPVTGDDEPHLYGDDQYLYYGRLCGAGDGFGDSKRVHVAAIPWATVPQFNLNDFNTVCPHVSGD